MTRFSAAAVATAKVGRNDPCPCGSGRKFKHCCQGKEANVEPSAGASAPAPPQRRRLQALIQAAKAHLAAERWAEAIPLLQEIARLEPNKPEHHHDLGVLYLKCGLPFASVASLEQALKLRPGWIAALSQLARALADSERNSEALQAYRRLSRIAEGPHERLFCAAKAFMIEGKLEEAEGELRRLLVLAPRHGQARFLLGRSLSRRGMFEEAARQLTQAIEFLPRAFEKLTAVKRMTESDRPLLDRMRLLAGGTNLDGGSRVAVCLGLGKAFDDLGDYEQAMRYYDEGNRVWATSLLRRDRAGLAAWWDSIIGRFTAEELARAGQTPARPASPGDDMPVFIVGMPRSGTTLVEQILSSHPAVAAGGELTFWRDRSSGWLASGTSGFPDAIALAKAAEDYRGLLRETGPRALRVTDKEPWNFMRLGLLRLAFPDARIIHCRRTPIDTCLSIFFANLWWFQYGWDRGDLVFYYRQYERLMEHWRRVLPADRFTEVDYERLIDDREAETRRLVDFCGLDWDEACLAPEKNGRVVKTSSLWQVRQPVYKTSVERWRRYEPWLGELRELLPAAERARSP